MKRRRANPLPGPAAAPAAPALAGASGRRLRRRGSRGLPPPAPAPTRHKGLLARAKRIRLLLLDVDGVLTDGRLYYGADGEALKAFDAKDGHGIVLLREHVALGVISGRPGLARRRLEELGFQHLVFSQRDKLAGYAELARLGVPDEEVAYMGDDLNDLPLLARVGLSACPSDARPEVRAAVHFVADSAGGRGAVRELCELLLQAKGLWPGATRRARATRRSLRTRRA